MDNDLFTAVSVHLVSREARRNAWILWIALLFIVILITIFSAQKHTVLPAYTQGSQLWCEGRDLYGQGVHGYLYLPHAAILLVPVALLPAPLQEPAWRCFTIVALGWASLCLSRFGQRLWDHEQLGRFSLKPLAMFPVMTVLIVPLSLQSARSGQMNLPLAALMALSALAIAERRWWLTSCWLCLGLALKPLMLPMILAAWVLFPPLRARLLAALLILFALPFLAQEPAYVWGQYLSFVQKSRLASNLGAGGAFSDIFALLDSVGVRVSLQQRWVVRVAGGGVMLFLSRFAFRRCSHERGAVFFLVYMSCYVLLFNPRTENNTYMVAAIPLAILGAWAILVERNRPALILFPLLVIGMAAGYELSQSRNLWLSPYSCLIFFIYCTSMVVARNGFASRPV